MAGPNKGKQKDRDIDIPLKAFFDRIRSSSDPRSHNQANKLNEKHQLHNGRQCAQIIMQKDFKICFFTVLILKLYSTRKYTEDMGGYSEACIPYM